MGLSGTELQHKRTELLANDCMFHFISVSHRVKELGTGNEKNIVYPPSDYNWFRIKDIEFCYVYCLLKFQYRNRPNKNRQNVNEITVERKYL